MPRYWHHTELSLASAVGPAPTTPLPAPLHVYARFGNAYDALRALGWGVCNCQTLDGGFAFTIR